jgi:hypothetical protein
MKNGLLRFLVSALATIPKLSGIKVDCFFISFQHLIKYPN